MDPMISNGSYVMMVFPYPIYGYIIPYQWPALLWLLLLSSQAPPALLLACTLAEVQTSQEGSLIWLLLCVHNNTIGTDI